MRQIGAKKDEIARFKRFHAVPHETPSLALYDQSQFIFRMKMPGIIKGSQLGGKASERLMFLRDDFFKLGAHEYVYAPHSSAIKQK